MKKAFIALFLALTLNLSSLSSVYAAASRPRLNPRKQSSNTVHVKFKDDSGIKLQGGRFVSESGQDLSALQEVASDKKVKGKQRLFKDSEENLHNRRHELRARSGKNLSDLNKYYKLRVNPADLEKIVADLQQLPYVEHAYAQPLAAPSPSMSLAGSVAAAPAPAVCANGAVICEDFSANAANFTSMSGNWWVGSGRYNLSSPQDGGYGKLGPKAVHNTVMSGDFDITANATVTPTASTFNDFGLIFGYQNSSNYYFASYSESDDGGASGIFRITNGVSYEIANSTAPLQAGQQVLVKVQVRGTTVTAFLNNQQVASTTVQNATGKVGFGTRNDTGSFDNLNVFDMSTPPPADYTNLQTYRQAAPIGVGADAVTTMPGAEGGNVKIIDIEYSWNTAHEDLGKARQGAAVIPNGTPKDPFNDNNHGTAVLGALLADKNAYGVTGVAYGATLGLVNATNEERDWDMANAIYTAAGQMAAGDVMLIEQQTWGPTPELYDFVPVEWVPEVYDAIKYATSRGIIVVEAAGNGNQNLDDTSYYGSRFPMGKEDSGAIIVGAGENCSNTGNGTIPARSRTSASNYGSRINLQGPGNCVVSTGYGDLAGVSWGNNAYTRHFSGTSAAGPVVAGVIASFSSAYEQARGIAPTPSFVRDSLQATGTAQNTAAGSLSGNIGPLPNLPAALELLKPQGPPPDTAPPSAPVITSSYINSRNTPVFLWSESSDNVGVASYSITRTRSGSSETRVFSSPAHIRIYNDMTTGRNITYYYRIQAVDAAGNVSAMSNAVALKTRP